MNIVPSEDQLPEGLMEYFLALHHRYGGYRDQLVQKREFCLREAPNRLPTYKPRYGDEVPEWEKPWRITLPKRFEDQRNQLTGPGDTAKMVVQMLNSGVPDEEDPDRVAVPAVMIDWEDAMAALWANTRAAAANTRAALYGELTYTDKNGKTVGIKPSDVVIWTRVRGLHMTQRFAWIPDKVFSATLFDLALLTYRLDFNRLSHDLGVYIAKSESAEEAIWWREVFRDIAARNDRHPHAIKCMALIESHPICYEMEEFLFHLRDHIIGLNSGKWDLIASLLHFVKQNPAWMMPDLNSIPGDVPFFQRVRRKLCNVCHGHGALFIGGMTNPFPKGGDPEQTAIARAACVRDKRNERAMGADGGWTGHYLVNKVAVEQFAYPNQLGFMHENLDSREDLRPVPEGVGTFTYEGTLLAIRTTILYRAAALEPEARGAIFEEGYMIDLAIDRFYRLLLAQRITHNLEVTAPDGSTFVHSEESVKALYAKVLTQLQRDTDDNAARSRYFEGAALSLQMILFEEFDPS